MISLGHRTLKRELAVIQLVFWWTLLVYTIYSVVTKEAIVSDAIVTLTMAVAVYVWGFAFATFLADSAYKQIIPAIKALNQ